MSSISSGYGLPLQALAPAAKAGPTGKVEVDSYYQDLCKKYPNIRFNVSGGNVAGDGKQLVVNLSAGCLEKMANDPEFAKEVEFNLSGEGAAQSFINGRAAADGVEVYLRTVTYDADGNRQSSSGLQTVRGTRTSETATAGDAAKMQRKRLEELREKRREEKERLETLREQRRKDEALLHPSDEVETPPINSGAAGRIQFDTTV